ncbi:MAG: ATP-binding protein [Lachnospiraceae bacterium]|nr:ATP-binding protein [Lachnospiraceae bacterium]
MLFKREKYLKKIRPFYDAEDIIKVITGIRRCGKSSLMQTVAEELVDRGVHPDNIIYLDLDSRKYRKIKTADQLETLIESCVKNAACNYLFIDEVQNVTGFEEVVNAFRTDGGFSIFITGSNSYLLSGELITKLTGRYLEFELFTLSYDEYLQFKQFYQKPVDPNPTVEFNRYILDGGFPRTVTIDDYQARQTYVAGIIQEIFEKDIRRRVKVKDTAAFDAVRDYLINNFGATTSIKSLTEALVKNGIRITRATVSKYIQALMDAKILYECNRFDMKSKKSLSGAKKYYLADLSLYFSRNTDNRINYGPVLENIVYLYARSLNYAISVGRIGKLECDFIFRSPAGDYSYMQVAYTILLNRETEEREYRPLEEIRDNYPKYVGTIDYVLQKRNGIRHINLIEHMTTCQMF